MNFHRIPALPRTSTLLGLGMLTGVLATGCYGPSADDPGTGETDDGWTHGSSDTDELDPSSTSTTTGGPLPPSSSSGDDGGDPDTSGEPPAQADGPRIDGETSAGHPRPTWQWETPSGTEAFRVRIDGGAWEQLDMDVDSYRALTDLAEGDHLFEVQAEIDGAWTESGEFTTAVEYFKPGTAWEGVARGLHHSPYGNPIGVIDHNTFVADRPTHAENLEATLQLVHDAQAAGADLIELDIAFHDDAWWIEQSGGAAFEPPALADVLADPQLQEGDQVLALQIEGSNSDETALGDLLENLVDDGYAINGRPVILRAFTNEQDQLETAMDLLTPEDFPFNHAYFRFSALVTDNENPVERHDRLDDLAAAGFDAVEFPVGLRNLASALTYGRHLGLGVGVFTVREETLCASLRDEVDVMTSGISADRCADRIEDQNGLVYLNPWDQNAAGPITYADDAPGCQTCSFDASGTGSAPGAIESDRGDDRFGTSLEFRANESDHVTLYDADNPADGGYLVSMFANFDDLGLSSNRTLLAKSQSSGFLLEYEGTLGQIRFAVHVDGAYRFATFPADQLDGNDSYFIVASYGGSGRARIWVNGVEGTPSEELVGGVAHNDLPIVLGADPQPGGTTRYHWDGFVQGVVVQTWND